MSLTGFEEGKTGIVHELSQQHINIRFFKCTLGRRKGNKKLKSKEKV
jgi:hypothetical protein